MADSIARDSRAAWYHFCRVGGLDLADRDRELESQLKIRLSPSAKTLEEALDSSTTDQLVVAFFAIAAPFAEMFKDIIAFFVAAGAREGREQWVIKIEENHLDLAAFQSFLQTWKSIEGELDVPAIDRFGLGIPRKIAGDMPWWSDAFSRVDSTTGNPEVDAWLERYRGGLFDPYPKSLMPERLPPQLADAAAVAWNSANILLSTWSNYEDVMRDMRAVWNGHTTDLRIVKSDGFAPGSIGQEESDRQLGASVAILARLAQQPLSHLAEIEKPLKDAYARFGRRKLNFRMDLKVLERILSLPVWRQRHELYAVWIAIETVNGLNDHSIDLHHEDGKLTFAFKETAVATIKTARPEKRLIAERRSPLASPLGHGRVAGVQPDYGIWSGRGASESCGLVIEVKHYKKPAVARFREVLNDYARAHPKAKILLVNHGPAKDMSEGIASDVRDRCHIIGDLTTTNSEGRTELRNFVRAYVGDPIAEAPAVGSSVLLVDISGSMRDFLSGQLFLSILKQQAALGTEIVFLADDAIRDQMTIDEALAKFPFSSGAGTELLAPINVLRTDYTVELVTDSAGLADVVKAGLPIVQKLQVQTGLWHVTISSGD